MRLRVLARLIGIPGILWPLPLRRWLRGRLRERAFWITQAGVLAATALHTGIEAAGFDAHEPGLLGMLAHVPVILYIVPVSYAGFRYGFEGGVLTGVWAALLVTPNLFIWHSGGFDWLGELLLVVVVVSIGMVIAIPVEGEQRERARAETASRRLALLNEVTVTLLRTADLDDALRAALRRLLHILPLRSVTLHLDDDRRIRQTLQAPVTREPGEQVDRGLVLADRDHSGTETVATGMLCFSIAAGDGEAVLCADVLDGQSLSLADRELLTTVAAEVGIALDNARLHRENEQRLQSYVHQVTRAQEEERLRIARELHDVATHELLALCRDLDRLVDQPVVAGRLPERVQQLGDHARGIVGYLRRFSRDLRPTVLDSLGLAPALQWLTIQLSEETLADARFRLAGEPVRLRPEVELAVFRIAQEALRNATRHADATQVTVGLTYHSDGVEMEVVDDGSGFVVPSRLDRMVSDGRLGLLGMRERVQLVGGTFRIDSRPGAGTSVRVSVATRSSVAGVS